MTFCPKIVADDPARNLRCICSVTLNSTKHYTDREYIIYVAKKFYLPTLALI